MKLKVELLDCGAGPQPVNARRAMKAANKTATVLIFTFQRSTYTIGDFSGKSSFLSVDSPPKAENDNEKTTGFWIPDLRTGQPVRNDKR